MRFLGHLCTPLTRVQLYDELPVYCGQALTITISIALSNFGWITHQVCVSERPYKKCKPYNPQSLVQVQFLWCVDQSTLSLPGWGWASIVGLCSSQSHLP
jgi:hypothetical protein